ncbi:MAG: DUF2589 domain-containing protein [Planctomycetota bacterium]|nr:DUF2589 domain-containing protein [Planctomycetota bacterium]
MATHGQELGNLDFDAMIGGPLISVVNAQAQSSMATVDFIKSVGFDENGKLLQTTFAYKKDVETLDADGNPTGEIQEKDFELSVPFLTMLPIPCLRVEEATVDFNAKITSAQHRQVDTNMKFGSELTASAKWLWGSAKLKTSFSYQRNTRQGNKTARTYSMAIHVRAVGDEMPAGTERLLGILENSIKESEKGA